MMLRFVYALMLTVLSSLALGLAAYSYFGDGPHPIQGHTSHGSVVQAGEGSLGYLRDCNGRDDGCAKVCDWFPNFRNAMAFSRRVDASGNTTKSERTYDQNGTRDGCGHEAIGFSAERHSVFESGDFTRGSGESNHKGR